MTDHPFPTADIGFHQGTPVAMSGNNLQMLVTLCRCSLGRLTVHRTQT